MPSSDLNDSSEPPTFETPDVRGEPEQPLLWLFDIDGTLLISGGAGQHAMLQTLSQEFAIDEVTGDIPAAGRTDFAITRDLFEQYGIAPSDEVRDRFRSRYLEHLGAVLPSLPGTLLPGVEPVLQTLDADARSRMALLTGNYHGAAVAKLQTYGIDHYFERCSDESLLGGFGDDHPDRDDVARAAWEAASGLFEGVVADRTFVIGDTPSDVQCGKAIGAVTIAVATGLFDEQTLAATDPDVLLRSLDEFDLGTITAAFA